MDNGMPYSLHLGSDKNKKNSVRASAKNNVSGTTSKSNNAIQNAKQLSRVDKHNYRKYGYNQNGIEYISILHSSRDTSYHMSSSVIGVEIEIGFTTRENLPFYRVVNNHQVIFNELVKNKIGEDPWGKSMINQLLELYKVVLAQINNEILGFNIERPVREYLRYEDGRMKMRAIVNGENYVICDGKGNVEWEENLIHHETFICFNGKVYGFKREVTDEDYAKKVLSGMEEGKRIYKKIAAELKKN